MGKCCCAFGCTNRYAKSGIPFYRFPTDPEKRRKWIAAVSCKDWAPSEFSWICGAHFISGRKSNDPVSPDYVPSVFSHIKSPMKRKLVKDMDRYERITGTKKRKVNTVERMSTAQALLQLSEMEMVLGFVNHTLAPLLLPLCPCVILKDWNMDTRIC